MNRHVRLSTFATYALCALLALVPYLVFASPSGLNNIPTTDVAPSNVMVFQEYTSFGKGQSPAHSLGMKFGPAQDWEVGIDGKFAPSPTGPLALQVKRRFATGVTGLSVALGAANLASSVERAGHWDPYVVATKQLPGFRLHLGYDGHSENSGLFAGADVPLTRAVTARADWKQVNDRESSVSSLGFMWAVDPTWVVEGWTSVPSASGSDNSYVIKLDYVLKLGGGR